MKGGKTEMGKKRGKKTKSLYRGSRGMFAGKRREEEKGVGVEGQPVHPWAR